MKEIIRRAGGVSKLAAAVGRHHATVIGWKAVPPAHVRVVSQVTGLSPHQLRPDLWDSPPSEVTREPSRGTTEIAA
jgi:DNA-binding transcriptional regulator YdaS (Cro superfamily)